ncbi:MAG: ATP-binding protein [Bacillota bacterium]|nr:ATP-binding protein [Bacillota bacterium]MDW7677353.1 ATP-binding protein [Bacillota bacterium]
MKELALHILDIVQNSIVAKAALIQIEIEENTDSDLLKIDIIDDGHGMDEELLRRVTDPFTTTRTTRRVGLGLPLLKQAAEECNGGLQIHSRLNEGTTVNIWFQHSHIDRVPLGDMVETIITLLLNGNHFDLHYKHRVNQKEMSFDTREIREILGDVPFSHPDVISWVKRSLQDEIEELYQSYEG